MRLKPPLLAPLSLSGVLLAIAVLPSDAHSGRTNVSGCHTNRSTGDYHCHTSGATPQPVEKPAATSGTSSVARPVSPLLDVGQVLSIGDGDTLRVAKGDEVLPVRLACIDSPELAQAYGQSARERLQTLLPIGTSVSMRVVDTDRYGRSVAEVFSQGRNINLSLVESGHAVVYPQYLGNCDRNAYLSVEEIARQSSRVFWSQANPVMPWEFRRRR